MSTYRTVNAGAPTGMLTLAAPEKVITGAAATTFGAITGLNLNADNAYFVKIEITNPTGSDTQLDFRCNGDSTTANYDRVYNRLDTANTPSRGNDPYNIVCPAGKTTTASGWISRDPDGYVTFEFTSRENRGTSIQVRHGAVTWRTVANLVSVEFTGSVASSLGINSSVRIYKVSNNNVPVGGQLGYACTEATTPDTDTASTIIPIDNTIPQNTEGQAYAALDTTYYVKEASSLLDIELFLPMISQNGVGTVRVALYRDSGADAIAFGMVTIPASDYINGLVLRRKVPATAVGNTTFKVRWSRSSGTAYLNRAVTVSAIGGGVCVASLKVSEIKQ